MEKEKEKEKEKEISFDCITEAQKMFEDADDQEFTLWVREDVLEKLIKAGCRDPRSGKVMYAGTEIISTVRKLIDDELFKV